jgi:hypothetical protein
VAREELFGLGLKTTCMIAAGSPITQYEGCILSKSEADRIQESMPHGKVLSSHFASVYFQGPVINGFSVREQDQSPEEIVGGVPLSRHQLRGRGGGSFCNHTDDPNATLVRDTRSRGDSFGLFVVSLRSIEPGEFIHVNYGTRFIQSKRSNM